MLMSAISVVARLKVWNNFFLAFLIVCLVAVLAGVVCYSVPAIRARRMQKRLAESQVEIEVYLALSSLLAPLLAPLSSLLSPLSSPLSPLVLFADFWVLVTAAGQ